MKKSYYVNVTVEVCVQAEDEESALDAAHEEAGWIGCIMNSYVAGHDPDSCEACDADACEEDPGAF